MSSSKLFLFALLTKIPKSPTTHIFSKIPSPCFDNKIPKIPHHLHLLQNFISFQNFLSPSSLKFYFPTTRDLFIWVLSFSHPQLLLSLLKEIFIPSSLRSTISTGLGPSLSLLFSIVLCYWRSICMGTSFFSPLVAALSSQDFFFQARRSAISTNTTLCFCYPYQFQICHIWYLYNCVCEVLWYWDWKQWPWWASQSSDKPYQWYIYILTKDFYSIVHFGIMFRNI